MKTYRLEEILIKDGWLVKERWEMEKNLFNEKHEITTPQGFLFENLKINKNLKRGILESFKKSIDARLYPMFGHPSGISWIIERLKQDHFGTKFQELSFQLVKNNKLVGAALNVKSAPNVGLTFLVFVRPKYQGKGLGKLIMKKTFETFLEHNLIVSELVVTVENTRARKLYEKLGYKKKWSFFVGWKFL